jgi:ubiquinone/menaquinone biosynthesis C-methylase UbiE
MRRDWNDRAREDANFYVAFGRRDQDDEEFFASAADVVRGLEFDLRRLPAGANRRAWRALEIGCGPGRLMRPMSRNFGEIHGVDVSDEMIRRAAANLRGIPHAHVHHTSGADLAPFADQSFDFVYSYAVFQHIPSREVVMQYLAEAVRVLKPGGLIRAQLNGLDKTAKQYDTWSGVRIAAGEVREFTRERGLCLLALEGVRTQYMWITLRKPLPSETAEPAAATRIRRITNAHNSEPVAPAYGRFASITLWVGDLPRDCDLNSLGVTVDGVDAFACYIGPRESDGLQQVNVMLPRLPRTGLLPVELSYRGERLCEPRPLRVIPPGPDVPLLISATDGIDLLACTRIVTGTVKVTVEQTRNPESFRAEIGGVDAEGIDVFCTDPLPPRFEINFDVPARLEPGPHTLTMHLGKRLLGRVELTIDPRP